MSLIAGIAGKVRPLKYVALEDDFVEPGYAAADFWQQLRSDIQQIARI